MGNLRQPPDFAGIEPTAHDEHAPWRPLALTGKNRLRSHKNRPLREDSDTVLPRLRGSMLTVVSKLLG